MKQHLSKGAAVIVATIITFGWLQLTFIIGQWLIKTREFPSLPSWIMPNWFIYIMTSICLCVIGLVWYMLYDALSNRKDTNGNTLTQTRRGHSSDTP